jgi:uncharacterized membrane protein YccF (DUF307 family)
MYGTAPPSYLSPPTDRNTMKKYLGLACWIAALLIPFRYSILDTDLLMNEQGQTNNMVGLISFVAVLTFFFIGYWLVDSAKQSTDHGH